MSFRVKTLNIECPASASDVEYTGAVGFRGKVGLVQCNSNTADGSNPNLEIGLGAFSDATHRYACSGASADNVGTSVARRFMSTSRCIVLINSAGTLLAEADFVRWTDDGFVLHWYTVTSGMDVQVTVFGGTEVSATVTTLTKPATTTGNFQVTGLGLGGPPDLAFFIDPQLTSATTSTDSRVGIGAMCADGTQFTLSELAGHGLNFSNTSRISAVNKCIVGLNASEVVGYAAQFASFDPDALTVNFTTNNSSQFIIGVVAIRGIKATIGSATQPITTPAQQTLSCTGITPEFLMMLGAGQTANNTAGNTTRWSMGFGTSSSDRRCLWTGDTDNVDTTVADHNSDQTKIIKTLSEGVPTLSTTADIVTMNTPGSAVINWGTVDATARVFPWLLAGRKDQAMVPGMIPID